MCRDEEEDGEQVEEEEEEVKKKAVEWRRKLASKRAAGRISREPLMHFVQAFGAQQRAGNGGSHDVNIAAA